MVIFADGTYVELLNWIGPPVEFFDWAGKAPGLIDFALTSPQSAHETCDAVTKRLDSSSSTVGDGGLGVRYKEPLNGGRVRKDGQKVEWYVTKPKFDNTAPNVPKPLEKYFPCGRLDTSFFCHDVTERGLRVPYTEPSIAEHPSGAKGILSVEVLVPKDQLQNYAQLYASISGSDGSSEGDSVRFGLASPNPSAFKGVKGGPGIELRGPRSAEDEAWLKERGIGIRALKIFVPTVDGKSEEMALSATGKGNSVVLVKQSI